MGFFEFIGVVNEVWVAQERPGQASSAGLPLLHRFVAQSRIVNPGRTRGTTYFCTIVYPPPLTPSPLPASRTESNTVQDALVDLLVRKSKRTISWPTMGADGLIGVRPGMT